jgi:serine/threonine protein kinase/tetratricopeptide (TPR) repeat protein
MIGSSVLHYRIEEKLGDGGMGVVYRATDTKLGRQVALKFLPAFVSTRTEEKDRFLAEARTASKLDHPNIATIYEVNEADGKLFYAMSLVEGLTLKSLRQQGPVTHKQIIQIAIQIADGLTHAHERFVIHRDIKPQNVMVTSEGLVKILDFGLAKMGLEESKSGGFSTAGTAAYLSPEQAQGKPATPQSDLFSLGVTLYEMVSGQLPFKGEHPAALLYSVVHEDPPLLAQLAPDAPPGLVAIVERLMAKDPARRYASSAELAAQLRAVARDLDFSSFSGSLRARKYEATFGWRSVTVAILALLGLGIGAAFFLDSGTGRPAAAANQYDVAVMYFDDLSQSNGEKRVGEMVTELLITDLSRSPYLSVLSSQRLYDILKQLNREGQTQIDRSVASEIAQRAKARNMITGSILKSGDRTRLTVNIIDVSTGEVLHSEQVEGNDLFAMVDSVSVQVKSNLDLPRETQLAGDRPVSEGTTRNAEAYLHYVKGIEAYHRLDWEPARAQFDSAIALDSSFTLAYIRAGIATFSNNQQAQGLVYMNLGRAALAAGLLPPRESLMTAAFAAAVDNNVKEAIRVFGEMQRRFPDDKEAYFWQGTMMTGSGDTRAGIAQFEKSLQLDPDYPFALINLIEAYTDLEDFTNATVMAERYRNVRPDEATPRLTLAGLYIRQNLRAKARTELEAARDIAPESFNVAASLAAYFAREGYIDSIRAVLGPFMTDTSHTSVGAANWTWGSALYLGGRFKDAFRQMHETVEVEKRYGDRLATARYLAGMARAYLGVEEIDSARAIWQRAYKLGPDQMKFSDLPYEIEARAGNLDGAQAIRDTLLSAAKQRVSAARAQTLERTFDGWSAIILRDFKRALPAFFEARKLSGDPDDFSFLIGQSYVETGQPDKAREELLRSLNRYDPLGTGTQWLRSWYYLGRAQEDLGNRGDAIAAYRTFLKYWGKADRKLPEVEDAKSRLSELVEAS